MAKVANMVSVFVTTLLAILPSLDVPQTTLNSTGALQTPCPFAFNARTHQR
jgi:hypothetical protein